MSLTDERTGQVHDFTRKRGVDFSAVLAPLDSPAWALDRATLWNRVEQTEKRKDAQVCREFNIALPVELTHDQKIEVTREWVGREMVAKGMVVQFDAHDLASHNPHVHLMATMRRIEGDGFGQKAREWNDKAQLEAWRLSWEEYANDALKRAGRAERIDHRTLEAQGIDHVPTTHLGPHASAVERRTGQPSRKRTDWQEASREVMRQRAQEAARDKIKEATAASQIQALDEAITIEQQTLQELTSPDRPVHELAAELQHVKDALPDMREAVARDSRVLQAAAALDVAQRERDRLQALTRASQEEEKQAASRHQAALAKLPKPGRAASSSADGQGQGSLDQAKEEYRRTRSARDDWKKRHKLRAWLHTKGATWAAQPLADKNKELDDLNRAGQEAARAAFLHMRAKFFQQAHDLVSKLAQKAAAWAAQVLQEAKDQVRKELSKQNPGQVNLYHQLKQAHDQAQMREQQEMQERQAARAPGLAIALLAEAARVASASKQSQISRDEQAWLRERVEQFFKTRLVAEHSQEGRDIREKEKSLFLVKTALEDGLISSAEASQLGLETPDIEQAAAARGGRGQEEQGWEKYAVAAVQSQMLMESGEVARAYLVSGQKGLQALSAARNSAAAAQAAAALVEGEQQRKKKKEEKETRPRDDNQGSSKPDAPRPKL